MHFCDLSDYMYGQGYFDRAQTKNVGWLQSGCTFDQAIPSEEVLQRLWQYCSVSVAQTRGIHICDFCCDFNSCVAVQNDTQLLLGSAEIRVFGQDSIIYAAPTLIYHYVSVHHYNPPKEFLEALDFAFGPPNKAYFEKLRELDLEWHYTSSPQGSPFRLTPDGRKIVVTKNLF